MVHFTSTEDILLVGALTYIKKKYSGQYLKSILKFLKNEEIFLKIFRRYEGGCRTGEYVGSLVPSTAVVEQDGFCHPYYWVMCRH